MNRYIQRKTKQIIVIWASVLCVGLVSGCVTNSEQKMRQEAEQLLGISMPDQVEDLQFIEIPANPKFVRPYTAYTAYIRAKMSEEVYLDLLHELELTLNSTGSEAGYSIFLLSGFQQRESTPIWWKPNPIANEISGVGELRTAYSQSWIISTYDNGYAYFQSYEAGVQD